MSYYKPSRNQSSGTFNVADFNYQSKPVTYNNLKTTVQNTTTQEDEAQNALMTQVISTANTLSSQVNTNTGYQIKIDTLEPKVSTLEINTEDISIENTDPDPEVNVKVTKIQGDVKILNRLIVKNTDTNIFLELTSDLSKISC